MKPLIKFSFFFLLTVFVLAACQKDNGGLSAKDTVQSTGNLCSAIDLDITIINKYSFLKGDYNPWDYGAPNPNDYYDRTDIISKVTITQLGEFGIGIIEYADTAASSDKHYTYFQISKEPAAPLSIYGNCSVNFSKLIKSGGGSFVGSFTVTHGSGKACDYRILLPLTVTGNLNVNTGMVTLNIKGKAFY
jgi:hypothetical protein